jgi:hypothetical protein
VTTASAFPNTCRSVVSQAKDGNGRFGSCLTGREWNDVAQGESG